MVKSSTVILDELYSKVNEMMPKRIAKYKDTITKFMEPRLVDLNAVTPCKRIPFGAEDEEDMFNAVGITRGYIKSVINKADFGKMRTYAKAAKANELTILDMCIIRYFFLHKVPSELNLSLIHLSFSGKFYPSIHYGFYQVFEPLDYVMLYVVNNKLSKKFDIKTHGSVMKAILSIATTWLNSYADEFKSFEDEEIAYLIQQLHNRIKSFMKNIADVYHTTYKNEKDDILTYDSDSLDPDNYHLADSDSLRANRITESTMNVITSSSVNYKYCLMAATDGLVRADEIKSIIENIISDPDRLDEVKELIRLMIGLYYSQSKTKDVRDLDFIKYSISAKPNAKNKDIIRQKEIVENWLINCSPVYKRRKSRLATQSAYYKAVYSYFTFVISDTAKQYF